MLEEKVEKTVSEIEDLLKQINQELDSDERDKAHNYSLQRHSTPNGHRREGDPPMAFGQRVE
jgi:hypothetical protein